MRVAWFSPLPPSRSGIADYSRELLPVLAEREGLDLELFVDEGSRVTEDLSRRFPVHDDEAFPGLWESGRFDAVVYHLGNNVDFHARMWPHLLRIPGIVVLHEYMLHHLVLGMTLARGDAEGYVEEMRYAYGHAGEALARLSIGAGIPLDPWSLPLFERAVDASLGLIVHNDFTRDRVRASRPGTRIAKVPHHLSLRELEGPADGLSPAEARASLGLPANGLLVASFGFITPAKRLEVSLRAFARLRQEAPDALYLLVGEASPYYDFAGVLTPELSSGVIDVGRTELDQFLRYMVAADITVNLRSPSAGETSGTLIRLLGLGKAVIVSKAGAFAEIPDDCCAKIDLDATEEELLVATLRALATDRDLRMRMGENARRHIRTRHTLEGSARGYADFLRETVAVRPEPFRPVPPLAPYPPEDVLTDLTAAVAGEAADLGVCDDDTDFLEELAAILADFGHAGRHLGPPPPVQSPGRAPSAHRMAGG